MRDTTSVSESSVHNNSCYSSRSCSGSESSSLSSVDTVVSGMEEGILVYIPQRTEAMVLLEHRAVVTLKLMQ